MAHNELIQPLLVALISNSKKGSVSSCVDEVSGEISGEVTVLITSAFVKLTCRLAVYLVG